jgi:DNA helicase-2/ATP-dependent DNA helicase PcrA
VEAFYPRDEIIAAGLEIKEKIVKGADANQIAILVPKNRQVRSTIEILRDMGITVAGGESLDFFGKEETIAILRVLRIISNPVDGPALATSFFDKLSNIPPIKAHEFIRQNNMREFSLLTVQEERNSLFDDSNAVNAWLATLKGWLDISNEKLYTFVQKVGTEFLLNTAKNHEELVVRIEVLRTLLHLALMQTEKNPNITLSEFIVFLDRLQEYGESIPLAIFGPGEGVKVLTLHASKGLEFEYVWVAHMDERSFSGGRAGGFTLPESVHARTESRDEMVLKRQLYVALTRAKRFCTVSYSLKGYTGAAQELSSVVADIGHNFEKQTADQTEKIILSSDIKAYVENNRDEDKYTNLEDLTKIVAKDYEDRKVSVSLLNNFFECTWKWYFRNLLQLPEPKSDSLEFGNMVHGAIEQILKYKKEFVPEDKEVAKVISRWYKDRYPEISKEYQTEQSVSVSDERFPHLTMYGKIDLIEKIDNENVRVTDFKTGGVRKKNDIEKIDEEGRMSGYMRQLAMYSYLLDQSPKWKVDVSESRLEFVEAKTPAETFYNAVITHEHINMIAKDIADYDELVKTGQWVHRPCHYNSYGKNTECEYCKLAEIYK